MGRLDGKVALIVGAGPNNGGTIAHFMAREGAKVAVSDIVPEAAVSTVEFLTGKGYDAFAVPGDASNEDDVKKVVKEAVDHYGYIDTMVNLAGRQFRWPVTDINPHDWEREIGTYLTAGMYVTKHVSRAMIDKKKKGCMIHIISSAGHYGEAGNSGYSAAKAGLLYFSRAAAMDLAHLGIRVNTITPYFMEHNLWRFGAKGQVGPVFRTRYMATPDDFLASIPMGRFPRAADLAHSAVFLASDEAEFLTGVDIPCDGGTRFKYPAWQPGLYTKTDIGKYVSENKPTMYGEEVEHDEYPTMRF
jgi:NAD(P)-dependent dehydrogenase (short-subunit alcohol dehydrogenase family)